MKLIFVYNAKNGIFNSSVDFFHKMISPKTYPCSLNLLTQGSKKEKEIWTKFVNETSQKIVFHHIDDFEGQYRTTYDYPVVVREEEDQMRVIFTKEQLSKFKSTESFIEAIRSLNMIEVH